MTRLTIEICEEAWDRVMDLAMIERRTARDQAGWLLEAAVGLRQLPERPGPPVEAAADPADGNGDVGARLSSHRPSDDVAVDSSAVERP